MNRPKGRLSFMHEQKQVIGSGIVYSPALASAGDFLAEIKVHKLWPFVLVLENRLIRQRTESYSRMVYSPLQEILITITYNELPMRQWVKMKFLILSLRLVCCRWWVARKLLDHRPNQKSPEQPPKIEHWQLYSDCWSLRSRFGITEININYFCFIRGLSRYTHDWW